MKSKEIWKDIPNYEGMYQISDLWNVKSLSRFIYNGNIGYISKEKILKPSKNCKGYLYVVLCKNNTQKTYQIHQLMAISFLGHKPCGHKIVVDHIDNNPLNNSLENLQLISARKNASKDKNGYTSKYLGVSWSKTKNKWRGDIKINKKRKFLGYFKNELEAAESYERELNKII